MERIVMSEGFALKIRKVVTGGYWPDGYGYGRKRVPQYIHYVITHEGRRVDSALKLSRALKLARRAGLRLLREEIEHDSRCS